MHVYMVWVWLLYEPGVSGMAVAVAVAVGEAGAAGAVQAQPQHHVEDHRRARHRHHCRVLHESSVTDWLEDAVFGDLDVRNRSSIPKVEKLTFTAVFFYFLTATYT